MEISEHLLNTKQRNAALESQMANDANFHQEYVPGAQNIETKNESLNLLKHTHIPYILNGELYRIETQIGDNVIVKCCHCPPDRVYRGSVRSTGNFHMHIKRRHPDLLGKLHEMKVNSLLERRDRFLRKRKFNFVSQQQYTKDFKRQSPELDQYSKSKDVTQKFQTETVVQCLQMQQEQKDTDNNYENNDIAFNLNKLNKEPLNYSLKMPKDNLEKTLLTVRTDEVESNILNKYTSDEDANYNSLNRTSTLNDMSGNSQQQYYHNSLHNSLAGSHQSNVSLVKVENVFLASEQALDLSMPIDSGLGSTATTSTNSGYESIRNNMPTLNQVSRVGHGEHLLERHPNGLQHILTQFEFSLHNIQRELNERNRIETNRILFEIAKFKHIHPDFVYN